jgi:hypothetical protein
MKTCQKLFQFHNHVSTICIMGFKQPNSDMFWLLVGVEKVHNHCKNVMGPCWHPKIESACGYQAFCQGRMHLFSWGLIHQCRMNFISENLLGWKVTFKHNWRANLRNQIKSIILNGKKPLTTFVFQELIFCFMVFWKWVWRRKKSKIELRVIFYH